MPSPTVANARWWEVERALRRQGYKPQGLIEVLHAVQNAYGYLEPEALRQVAQVLRLPLSKVYGVATFYHHFSLTPPPKHQCVVCLGTVCHIKGGKEILQRLEERWQLKAGQSNPNRSLGVARCIGACTLAPAVVLDGQTLGPLSPDEALKRTGGWQ